MRLRPWTAVACAVGVACAVEPVVATALEQADGSLGARGALWQRDQVELVVDASVESLGPHAFDAVVKAASAWQSAAPGLPALVVRRGDSEHVGYRSGGHNRNVVRFEANGEARAHGALAITVLTYDSETGEILDADIVLNGIHPFSAEGAAQAFDLQNVLTHELGHFLGLGEDTDDLHATMYAYSEVGETTKRVLDEEDIARIMALYRPSATVGALLASPPSSVLWAGFGAGLLALMARLQRRFARELAIGAVLGALALVAPGDGTPPSRIAAADASGPDERLSVGADDSASTSSHFSIELGALR
jgi:hypothetical protein